MATGLTSLTRYDVLKTLAVPRTAKQIAHILGCKAAGSILKHLNALEVLGKVEKMEVGRGAWASVWRRVTSD